MATDSLFVGFQESIALLVARKLRHDVAGQQLFLAEQTSVLERLAVGKIAQRVETELEQERLGGDIGIGVRPAAARAGLTR
jgi:predicted acetyltransferase